MKMIKVKIFLYKLLPRRLHKYINDKIWDYSVTTKINKMLREVVNADESAAWKVVLECLDK
jgi:hypothetical protein